ncbi:MAG: CHASE3 domain-containing protein [Anaerolineae bacterium]
MKWILKRRTSLNVGLVLILIVALVVASTYAGRQSRASTQQVEHTLEVLSELEHLRSELFDVETAQRGYILTSDASWLSIYSTARESVTANVQRLRDLIADNPNQLSRLDTLEITITERFDSLDETLSVFESQGLDAARQRITTGVGRELMNEVRQFLEAMETEERNLLSERRAEATRTIRWVYLVFGAFALVGVGLLLLVYYMSRRAARDRERGKEELREREALYRQIVQQLPDMAVLLYDPQLRFTLAAGGLFDGVGGEKIDGHPMHEIVPPPYTRNRNRSMKQPCAAKSMRLPGLLPDSRTATTIPIFCP